MTAWRDKRSLLAMVATLRAVPLSARAIGRVVGLSHTHVRRLLAKVEPFSS